MAKVAAALVVSLAYKLLVDASSSESENETSSEDELLVTSFVIKRKLKKKPVRIINYIENVVPNYSPTQFQQNFRISVEAYENLRRIVAPSLQRVGNTGRSTIDIDKQLMSVIWLLATPDSYRSVGERFDMGKSSLSAAFKRVVKVLNRLAPQVISWPTGDRQNDVKRKFQTLGQIENIIGAVDGRFIPIKAPKEDGHSYVTRKCNYAMTLQGICDPYLKFTDAFVGYPGSVSDTRIFRNSVIYSRIQNNTLDFFPNGEFIIGDKAYPILPWCIPLYVNRGNLSPAQRYFNTKMSQSRQVIERTFALFFGRFRRLRFLDMNRTDLIPATVLAACVLHNLCLDYDDLLMEEYIREGRNHVLHNEEQAHLYDDRAIVAIVQEGRNIRNQMCNRLFHNRNNM